MKHIIANYDAIPEDYRHAFVDDPAALTTKQLAAALKRCCSRHNSETDKEMRYELTDRADRLMAEFRKRQRV